MHFDNDVVKLTKNKQPEQTRLPCRGCRKNCKNYSRCGGKPWRMQKLPVE